MSSNDSRKIPRGDPKPWYTHVTIDLLARLVNRSLLHPFIAWLIPLCLRAVDTPQTAPKFVLACIWAVAVTAFAIFGVVDRRVAYGSPREVDWADEVVVITGGASGLGRLLAQMYSMRGASVAVMDIRVPTDGADEGPEMGAVEGVRYHQCDVANAEAVESARELIEKDLGPPTILINNAAIVHGQPFLSLSPSALAQSISINLLGPIHTLRTFLPGMLAAAAAGTTPGATIVTISSVLGKLGAARVADYAAAKAGLIALHRSLAAELGPASPCAPPGAENLRLLLVAPGQLGTRMFAGVESPSPFWGPVVEPVVLASRIVEAVDGGWSGEIAEPLYARWIEWMAVLPVGMQRLARWMSGVDRAMEGFGDGGSGLGNSEADRTDAVTEK